MRPSSKNRVVGALDGVRGLQNIVLILIIRGKIDLVAGIKISGNGGWRGCAIG